MSAMIDFFATTPRKQGREAGPSERAFGEMASLVAIGARASSSCYDSPLDIIVFLIAIAFMFSFLATSTIFPIPTVFPAVIVFLLPTGDIAMFIP